MKKAALAIVFMLIIGLCIFLYWHFSSARNTIAESEEQQAIRLAQEAYENLKTTGTDFSNGPCIAENVMPDWVADIAHNPRQAVDDLPKNQCQSFREGKAHHFVELDVNGEVIRAH